MKWTTFMPVLNEAKIIESKIKHCLEIGKLVVVEGSIPQTYNVGEDGMSTDGTTEILESYSDKMVYVKAGKQKDRIMLQNIALREVHVRFPDTDILHRTDADEFIHLDKIKEINDIFASTQLWLLYTDLVNFVDGTNYKPNVIPQGQTFNFNPSIKLSPGTFHERFYRYRSDLMYKESAHALQDSFNRMLYAHPDYFFNRGLFYNDDIKSKIFHYKYVDGFENLLLAEMSYLKEDENMMPRSQELFDKAKMRLKNILDGGITETKEYDHCKEVLESKWYNREPIKYNWDITLDDILELI